MAVEVCHDAWTRVACLYDNTTDTAFGPIFKGIGAGTEAEDFLDWLRDGVPRETTIRPLPGTDGTDPRHYMPHQLEDLVVEWNAQYRPDVPEPQSLRVDLDDIEGHRIET